MASTVNRTGVVVSLESFSFFVYRSGLNTWKKALGYIALSCDVTGCGFDE